MRSAEWLRSHLERFCEMWVCEKDHRSSDRFIPVCGRSLLVTRCVPSSPLSCPSAAVMKAEIASEQALQRQRQEFTESFHAQLTDAEQRFHRRESEWRESEAKLHDHYRAEIDGRVRTEDYTASCVRVCRACAGVGVAPRTCGYRWRRVWGRVRWGEVPWGWRGVRGEAASSVVHARYRLTFEVHFSFCSSHL